jgi:hypothetical protein
MKVWSQVWYLKQPFVVPYNFAFRTLNLQRIEFELTATLIVPFTLTPIYRHGVVTLKRRSLWQSERRCWKFISSIICRECMALRSFETSVTIWQSAWRNVTENLNVGFEILKFCKSVHHHTTQINQTTRCKNFRSLLLDVYLQINMFLASSRPSSGAQQLQ